MVTTKGAVAQAWPERSVVDRSADPRVARTRARVIAAAIELLLEGGAAGVTVEAIVARTGVARTTVYRHWANRDDLVRDTFESLVPTLPVVDPHERFADAVVRIVDAIVDILADERWQRVFTALLEEARHGADLALLEASVTSSQRQVMRETLSLGVAEGVLPAGADLDEAVIQLIGPLVLASIDPRTTLDRRFGRRMIELFLASRQAPG